MKSCTTLRGVLQKDGSVKEKPCGNRVLPFVDPQPADQCFSCYTELEDGAPKFDTGLEYKDKNDGGLPK